MEECYPLSIDFGELNNRVKDLKSQLNGIIAGMEHRVYLRQAIRSIKKLESRKAQKHGKNVTEIAQISGWVLWQSRTNCYCKYVSLVVFEKRTIPGNIEVWGPRPMSYIQQVLIPETVLVFEHYTTKDIRTFVEKCLMEQNINNGSNERVYTQSEMENITQTIINQIDNEKEARLSGSPIPVEISEVMANISIRQRQDNFKKFKRDTKKYNLDEWTTPEKIKKSIFPYLKRHTTETAQVAYTI
ncbi:hypothetical protein BDC45DRAFT_572136 [Circinella umbellata]|nr:hypothetical protein BDC45DRAFT_572136 [Circinella umbellata]